MNSAYAAFQQALANKDYHNALLIFGDTVAFITANSIQAELSSQEGDEEEAARSRYLAQVGQAVVDRLLEDLAKALHHPQLRPSRNPQ